MLGGFKCSRNSLIVLNIFYFIVGVLLIGLGGHWLTSNQLQSLPIIGGVVACGVFLSIISIVGLIGTVKHAQVMLFFYMVTLLFVFLIQFSIACACLTVSSADQKDLVQRGWESVSNSVKSDAQKYFECCGYKSYNISETEPDGHPSCVSIEKCRIKDCVKDDDCCSTTHPECACDTCEVALEKTTGTAFSTTGGVSLFFSFTEFIGVWLTFRYRNQKNPNPLGNPSAFL